MSGGDTCSEAHEKQVVIHETLKNANLPLVKYASNSREFLKSMDNNLVDDLKRVEFASKERILLVFSG